MPTRTTVVAAILLSMCLAACGGSVATPEPSRSPSSVLHSSLTVDGRDRTYRMFLPPLLGLHQTAPLVIALHGATQDGDEMAALTGFDDEATAGRFIVAYPDGIGRSWNAGGCCGDARAQGVDDVAFISKLLEKLTVEYQIDLARVYVVGLSNGALMAYRLACDLSDRIAAIASVSGTMVIDHCLPARPISVLDMHGTDDAIVPYGGGTIDLRPVLPDRFTVPSNAAVIQRWVTLDGCMGTPALSSSGITSTSSWSGCTEGTVVSLDAVTGGQHTWFGSTFDPVPGEPNANAMVWTFFSSLGPKG